MSRVAIITDSSVHFPFHQLPVYEGFRILHHYIDIGDQLIPDRKDLTIYTISGNIKNSRPRPVPPSVADFQSIFNAISLTHSEIIVILLSEQLSHAISNAQQAVNSFKFPASIDIIDSQTTSAGLGFVVSEAVKAAQHGLSAHEICQLIRWITPRIYTAFCLPDLHFIAQAHHLDPSQATVGEMLGLIPFYIMENNRLIPIQKARSQRHLVDILYEFIEEFFNIQHIALLYGLPFFEQESRNLRERIHQHFPSTAYTEHYASSALAAMLGPHCLGMIAIENIHGEIVN